MKKNKITAASMTLIFTLSVFPFNVFASDKEVKRFCTMDGAVEQLLNAAGIAENLKKEPAVITMAEDIIGQKLAARPTEFVKIVWKDIYDMRGSVNAWLAHNGHPLNHIGQAIDAAGSALTGTIIGKVIMTNALMLAGPAGFIMLGGMNVTQETFQCNPSGVVMAVNAGATIIVLVPWCKVPGINKGCVALTNGVSSGIKKVAASVFGKELSATFLKETTHGVVMALRLKSKDKVMTAMEILNYLDGRKSFRNPNFELRASASLNNSKEPILDSLKEEINWDNR
ncbi:MAG: hypothetical protein KKH28_13795 [Elusimicrobia bacterium]|nr:hypothetical protein [Elusimicrobiota bacterium]